MMDLHSERWYLVITLSFLSVSSVFEGADGEVKLLILHNNDMHCHFEEMSRTYGSCTQPKHCYGGFPRTAKAVQDIRKEKQGAREVLFLNAGDTFQGTPYFSIFHYKVVMSLIDYLKIDVMSLGNHEFDDGPEDLVKYLAETKTPTVTCNVKFAEPFTKANMKPSTVLIRNGMKIAVIGYLTPKTKYLANIGNTTILDEIESINEEIEKLKKEGVTIFIALGHSGYVKDLEIAEKCPEVDLVIGGHTNTFLYTGNPPDIEVPDDVYPKVVTQPSGRKVPVVQAFAYTKYLGYLEIDFNDKGEATSYMGNPRLLTASYPQDEETMKAVDVWKEKLAERVSKVVGSSLVFLNATEKACKMGECNLGNIIADSYVDYFASIYDGKGWTDAPIGIIQAGGIRNSINASANNGNVTHGDVMMVLPFQNKMFRIELTGATLRNVMEYAVHAYEMFNKEQHGEFLQVSGLMVSYNLSAPSGSRVVSLKARCGICYEPVFTDVVPTEKYGVLLTSYIMNGGDNFTIIENNIINKKELNITDTGCLERYFVKRSPVYPAITNRVTFTDKSSVPVPTTPPPPSSSSINQFNPFVTLFIVVCYLCLSYCEYATLGVDPLIYHTGH